MANEFKIKKGLIVTGASGGTVVDIQGSQGQLFSVTDDLSGSIFAVSDISGVPIFDVNSSGLSTFDGSANFTGTIGIGTAPTTNAIEIDGADGSSYVYFKSSAATTGARVGLNGDDLIIENKQTSGDIIFDTAATERLRIASGGAATFAGDVTIPEYIYHTGNTSQDYFGFAGNDTFVIRTNGTDKFTADANSAILLEAGIIKLQTTNTGVAVTGAATATTATTSTDNNATLTTKGYVDGLVTGVPVYKGTWDARNNTERGSGSDGGDPDLRLTVNKILGNYYIVETAGSATPNGANTEPSSWNVGDWCIFSDVTSGSGTDLWQKIDNTSVISGAGTGQSVTKWEGTLGATSETLTDGPITFSGNNSTFAGTITSGNITVNGSSRALTVTSSNDEVVSSFTCSGDTISTIGFQGSTSTSDYHVRIGADVNNLVAFTNNIIRMTINSSGNTTFTGTSSALTVIARDNLFVDAGQLYIGADNASTDNTFRQVVNTGAGSFTLQKRISGTFTDILSFNNANNATFAGDVTTSLRLKSTGANTQTNTVASSALGIALQNTSNTDGNFIPIDFFNSTGFVTARIGAEFQDAGDRNTDLYFCTRANSGSLTERMRIASDGKIQVGSDKVIWAGGYGGALVIRQNNATGDRLIKMVTVDSTGAIANDNVLVAKGANVGIGTDSPTEISSGATTLEISGTVTTKSGALRLASSDNSLSSYFYHQSSGLLMGTATAQPIRIITNNSEKIRIESAGNVGIGTTSPSYRLQIGVAGGLADSIRIGSYAVAKDTRQYIGYARANNGLFESSGDGDTPSTVMAGVAGIRIVNTTGTLSSGQADNSVQLLTHIYNGGSRVALHANYNGNVGIGVTDPEKKLEVKSDTTYDGIMLDVLSAPEITFRDRGNSDTRIGTGRHQLDGFHIDTYSGNAFLIKGSNRFVGIGTTSPKVKLNIVGGDVQLDSGQMLSFYTGAVANVQNNGIKGSDTDDSLRFYTGALERVTIDGGDVGIGETSPAYKLHVTSASTPIAIFTGANNAYVDFSDPSSSVRLQNSGHSYFGTQTNTNLNFKTNGSQKMTILANGNVGIGTTNPVAAFQVGSITATAMSQVVGKARIVGTNYIPSATQMGTLDIASTTRNSSAPFNQGFGPSLTFSQNISGYVDGYEVVLGAIKTISTQSGNTGQEAAMTFLVNGGTSTGIVERMRIDSVGNVGIGTDSPLGKLQVNEYTVASQGNQTLHGEVSVFADNGDESLFLGLKDSAYPNRGWAFNPVAYGINSSLQIKEHGSTAVRMTIQSGGNVGIGNTDPQQKLHIVDTDGANIILNSNTGAENNGIWMTEGGVATPYVNGAYVHYDSTNNVFKINTGTSTLSTRFEIARNTGAVKFNNYNSTNNTGTPTYLLGTDASGNVVKTNTVPGSGAGPYLPLSAGSSYPLTGDLYLKTAANEGNLFFGTASASYKIFGGGTYGYMGYDTGGYHRFLTSGSEKMRITSAGNVGIGTTSPGAKLHTKVGTSGGAPYDNSVGIFAEGATRSIIQMSSTSDAYLMFGDASVDNQAWFGYNHTADQLLLHTGGTITMDGNVGIGTTSPGSRRLSVVKDTGITAGFNDITEFLDTTLGGGGSVSLNIGKANSSKNLGKMAFKYVSSGSNSNALNFGFYDADNLMTLQAGGNVGIGTSTPNAKLDIQGTQGQLFSVTDNLSGSIFAVSDISGVPIFDVNSSGLSTFDGNINVNAQILTPGGSNLGLNPNTGLVTVGGTLQTSSNVRVLGQNLFLSTSSVFNKITLNGTDMEIWSGALFPSIDITNTGLLKFGAYALSGAGTPTKLLGVDSSGNVLTTVSGGDLPGGPYLPLAGGTMTGTGSVIMPNSFTLRAGNSNNSAPAYTFRDDTNTGMFQDIDDALSFSAGGATVLHMDGNDAYIPRYITHLGDTNTYFGFVSNDNFIVATSGAERIRINGSGNVGIGTTGPDVKFHVTANEDGSGIDKGAAKFINTNTGQGATTMHMVQTSSSNFANAVKFWQGSTPTAVGFIRLTTSATQFITSASDLNLKKNITNWSDDTLSKFKALEPKKFRFKTQDVSEDKTLGFIAQNEVDNFPEAYPQFLGDNEQSYYGFNPTGMVPHLMKAIKDLVEKVETLENRITQLENNN